MAPLVHLTQIRIFKLSPEAGNLQIRRTNRGGHVCITCNRGGHVDKQESVKAPSKTEVAMAHSVVTK
jgi:hypothetical protein